MSIQKIRSIKSMQKTSRDLAAKGKRIGLVPTMGYLHDGHLSLIRRARKDADVVVTSIFVNPTQFGPREDLSRYPRDEKGDIRKIESAGGDIVFIPKARDVYPRGFQTWVTVEKMTQTLEGASRPTHFRGVTTVVAKLFNIVRPDVVVFGLKDYQQAIVLEQMVRDLGYPMKFIIGPTVREKDGLAMSSRNRYFTEDQRAEAVCLYEALKRAKALVNSGTRDTRKIQTEMKRVIKDICPSAAIDYIAFTDFSSLEPVREADRSVIASLAVTVHGVRLIDNMKLG